MSSMKSQIRKTLIQKLNDALVAEVPELTRREIRLPNVPGKAIAVIGSNGFWKKLIESLGSVFVTFKLFCGRNV